MPLLRFAFIVAAVAGAGNFIWATFAAAQPSSESSAAGDSSARVAQWIADLDSDRFAVRNAAARQLVEVGEAAIPLLAESLDHAGAEATWRSIQILSAHSRYGTPQVSAAALDALAKVASSTNSVAARRAAAALEEHRSFRHAEAVFALRGLGAYVADQGTEAAEVRLDNRWRGEDHDLSRLRQVNGLRMLSVSGSSVSDAALAHIGEAKGLERLFLGESKIRGTGLQLLSSLSNLY
jgi:hypothetical protein